MIDLHYWPTPNGKKVTILLEECGLPYRIVPCSIGQGDQFKDEFLRISPNNRMPAIVDHEPPGGGEPVSVFESGAILIYLAEKSGQFLPADVRGRAHVLEWLMWQMGGFGPMLGQNHHFNIYAPEKVPYAIDRYVNETSRLYGVLDKQLAEREWICGDYSIADMACWGWVVPHDRQGIDLDQFEHVRRWYDAMKERPGVQRGFSVGIEIRRAMSESQQGGMDEEAKKVLFGQTADTLRKADG